MHIQDRIKGLKRVRAGDLRPNPRNWRVHPQSQKEALRGILAEVGYVDALLARELPDGALELIDGHLRAETTPDSLVPVLIVDLDENEANKVLATFDPLASMAGTDEAKLRELVAGLDVENQALAAMLEGLARQPVAVETPAADALPERWDLLVRCQNEQGQTELLTELTARGFECRALIS